MRATAAIALLLAAGGCANVGNGGHMEAGSFTPRNIAAHPMPERLTIVITREQTVFSRISHVPWDAYPLALNGKMVAFLPVGSHIVLVVEPGTHILKWSRKANGILVGKDEEYAVAGPAGAIRYVALKAKITDVEMTAVPEDAGRSALASTAPARLLHNGTTWDIFKGRSKAANTAAWDALRAAMPDGETVNSALEAVGAIALIGLHVAAATQSNTPSLASVRPSGSGTTREQTSSALRMDTLTSPQRTNPFSYGKSETSERLKSANAAWVRDYRTGTTYTIEDDSVRGSDGSRFKIVGNSLISETGVRYQITGNSLRAPDGRTCRRVLDTVHCD